MPKWLRVRDGIQQFPSKQFSMITKGIQGELVTRYYKWEHKNSPLPG